MVESSCDSRFQKHFDTNYNCAYYFDKETGESIWELPEGVDEARDVVDCTGAAEDSGAVQKADEKEDEGVEKYQAHMSTIDQMQREALAMLYPDALLAQEGAPSQTADVSTGQTKEVEEDSEDDFEE